MIRSYPVSTVAGFVKLLDKSFADYKPCKSHLFLSGGFGSSPYVQKRLRAVLERYGVELICPKDP